jgi:hypothetical protein
MAIHSDDTPLAWVWSEYRGERVDGAPGEDVEVAAVVERIETDASSPATESAAAAPGAASAPGVSQGSAATGPILAALILTILGLLWFASTDKKPEATAVKSAAPSVSSETAPSTPPPPPATAAPVVTESATPAPAPAAAPAPGNEQHGPRHRQRRHR